MTSGAPKALAKVLYFYKAEGDDELTIHPGETIEVLENDEDWWLGNVKGNPKTGFFPSNFVKLIESKPPPPARPSNPPRPPPPVEPVHIEQEKISQNMNRKLSQQAEAPAAVAGEKELANVIEDYEATSTQEVSLIKDDVITILEKSPSGWWKAEVHGKVGLFPSKCVTLVEERIRSNSINGVSKIEMWGVKKGGIGSLFTGGIPNLKKPSLENEEAVGGPRPTVKEDIQLGTDGGSQTAKSKEASFPLREQSLKPSIPIAADEKHPPYNETPAETIQPSPPKASVTEQVFAEMEVEETVIIQKIVVKANYNYKAQDDEEICLIKGEEVEVLGESEHDGWLVGKTMRNETGIFPSNFASTPFKKQFEQKIIKKVPKRPEKQMRKEKIQPIPVSAVEEKSNSIEELSKAKESIQPMLRDTQTVVEPTSISTVAIKTINPGQYVQDQVETSKAAPLAELKGRSLGENIQISRPIEEITISAKREDEIIQSQTKEEPMTRITTEMVHVNNELPVSKVDNNLEQEAKKKENVLQVKSNEIKVENEAIPHPILETEMPKGGEKEAQQSPLGSPLFSPLHNLTARRPTRQKMTKSTEPVLESTFVDMSVPPAMLEEKISHHTEEPVNTIDQEVIGKTDKKISKPLGGFKLPILPAHLKKASDQEATVTVPAPFSNPSSVPVETKNVEAKSQELVELKSWFTKELDDLKKHFTAELEQERLARVKLEDEFKKLRRGK